MKTILFQGDSITDADRSRQSDFNPGHGYPVLVESDLSFRFPGEYTYYNRGVSGDKSNQLYARCKRDIINLKPDYMSILIGVNDVWHDIASEDGVTPERYFDLLSMLIEDVTKEFPEIRIAILEPFVLKGTATENAWDRFRIGVAERAKKAKEVAEKYSLIFVPLQDKFNEAAGEGPTDIWLADGVHPAPAGHRLIANEWLKAFGF